MKTRKKSAKKIPARELDILVDEGKKDIIEHFDLDTSIHRILVDFPQWMLEELDTEAKHLGIPRQAVIKTWINDRIRTKRKLAS